MNLNEVFIDYENTCAAYEKEIVAFDEAYAVYAKVRVAYDETHTEEAHAVLSEATTTFECALIAFRNARSLYWGQSSALDKALTEHRSKFCVRDFFAYRLIRPGVEHEND